MHGHLVSICVNLHPALMSNLTMKSPADINGTIQQTGANASPIPASVAISQIEQNPEVQLLHSLPTSLLFSLPLGISRQQNRQRTMAVNRSATKLKYLQALALNPNVQTHQEIFWTMRVSQEIESRFRMWLTSSRAKQLLCTDSLSAVVATFNQPW